MTAGGHIDQAVKGLSTKVNRLMDHSVVSAGVVVGCKGAKW